jgi:hypothetical protein
MKMQTEWDTGNKQEHHAYQTQGSTSLNDFVQTLPFICRIGGIWAF